MIISLCTLSQATSKFTQYKYHIKLTIYYYKPLTTNLQTNAIGMEFTNHNYGVPDVEECVANRHY